MTALAIAAVSAVILCAFGAGVLIGASLPPAEPRPIVRPRSTPEPCRVRPLSFYDQDRV